MKFRTEMINALNYGRELIQKEPLKSNQLDFYAAELLPKLTEREILAAVKHHSLDNHWPSINEILAFNQKATSDDKAEAEKLVQRAINLLRHSQRYGYETAKLEDPEALALLSRAGRWYDLHTRCETPRGMTDLRFELKVLAADALRTSKQDQQALSSASDDKRYLE